MRVLKNLSLILFFGLLFTYLPVYAQEDTLSQELTVEFQADEINAKTLDVEAPEKTEGDGGYWWQNTKRNLDLFFTFNQEKKAEKEQIYASKLLLEAKQLSEEDPNNSDAVTKTLERYNKLKEKLANRVKNNENVRNRIQNTWDNTEFRHQQLMLEIGDKMPAEVQQKVQAIKKENIERWYNAKKENIDERLEKVIDQNNTGSQLKQIRNWAVLDDIQENLPEDAQEKIEAAKTRAEDKLSDKLENIDPEKLEKVQAYVENIKVSPAVRYKVINSLSNSENIPSAAKQKINTAAKSYADKMKEKWQNLDNEGKEKFLQTFDTRAHPIYVDVLDQLDNATDDLPAELRNRLQEIKKKQIEGVKQKIQNTTDVQKLRSFENNIQNTELRKTIRTRRIDVTPTLTPQIQQIRQDIRQ